MIWVVLLEMLLATANERYHQKSYLISSIDS